MIISFFFLSFWNFFKSFNNQFELSLLCSWSRTNVLSFVYCTYDFLAVLEQFWSCFQVIDGSISFDSDYLTFCSPRPKPLPKYLVLINPFESSVWLSFGICLIIFTLLFYLFARIEGQIFNVKFREWDTLPRASWFALGKGRLRVTIFKSADTSHIVAQNYKMYCFSWLSTPNEFGSITSRKLTRLDYKRTLKIIQGYTGWGLENFLLEQIVIKWSIYKKSVLHFILWILHQIIDIIN